MEVSMSNSPQSDLIIQLGQKYEEYQRNPEAAARRCEEEAYEQASEKILTGVDSFRRFEQGALDAAGAGQKTYRLLAWQGRGPQYCRKFLTDMLDAGCLLEKLQAWLDKSYGEGNFRIFNHHIKFSRNGYALVVSWDIDKFYSIGEIIASNRAVAEERRLGQSVSERKLVPPYKGAADFAANELGSRETDDLGSLSWDSPAAEAQHKPSGKAYQQRKGESTRPFRREQSGTQTWRNQGGSSASHQGGSSASHQELVDPDEPLIFSQPSVQQFTRRVFKRR
jgi:hypothetical protein